MVYLLYNFQVSDFCKISVQILFKGEVNYFGIGQCLFLKYNCDFAAFC